MPLKLADAFPRNPFGKRSSFVSVKVGYVSLTHFVLVSVPFNGISFHNIKMTPWNVVIDS